MFDIKFFVELLILGRAAANLNQTNGHGDLSDPEA
jgi:hypothetical protein